MANSLALEIGKAEANGKASLQLTTPDGVTAGTLDTGQLTEAFSLAKIHDALNDKVNRDQAEAIGKGLFERLFVPGTPIRNAWDTLAPASRRLPLELTVDDPELRRFPWELIWDASDRRHARAGGIVRRVRTKSGPPPQTSEWPFRVLLIIGTDDARTPADQRIGADQEIEALKRGLANYGRSVDLLRLTTPARAKLQEKLKTYQPHVVHFIGHGTYQLGDRRYSLLIETAGGTWNWDTKSIVDDFEAAACVPRLVFLNCCRSAEGVETASRATISLQDTFTNTLRVGAVVAMQADVRGDRAAAFSRAFYGQALAGPADAASKLPSVTTAAQEGRKALGADADVDWGLPTLTLCSDIAIDAELNTRHAWPDDPAFRLCREFDEARIYADECDARREMIHWFYPVTTARQPNVLIVKGPPGSGKSRLLHWCMESWAANGGRMRQLRVDQARGKNCLKWLIRLRAGMLPTDEPDPERFLKAPLELTPFLPFYDAVSRAAGLSDGPAKVDDPGQRVELIDSFQREVADDVPVEALYADFLKGLQGIGPMVVTFDQLSTSAIAPELFTGFRDKFLLPIGTSPDSGVRVAVTVSENDYDKFGLKGLGEQAATVVTLRADHKPEELEALAVEAVRYNETVRVIAKFYLDLPPDKHVGLGLLSFCQPLLLREPFRSLERMK